MDGKALEFVGISEMLTTLIANGRSAQEAASQLGRAFQTGQIRLADRHGNTLNEGDYAFMAEMLHDRAAGVATTRNDLGWLRVKDDAIGGVRFQFELACGLSDKGENEPQATMTRIDAVRTCLEQGMTPANTVSWAAFYERVRDLADGWVDKKQGTIKRGFDDKTIWRDVKRSTN
ncbi:hypothetical protein JQ609_19930 [Bradyrhizobium sp. AUGA SZCCT0169]|uniref:hypothetical protein n=1 Tax=Bradyrhizobium sp. AUGA SZCCT0169 TaxID=2807663 RepID=UPI001BACE99C|nr:hypothetical protein [Bradyrhizobium sp. AUGA SZCCT0169]MBR1249184.1 hypothetical protein [Bradyrhizobium sp. AUGA SZCCT0169]